jgi:predicted dehydrogenase
MNILIIGLGSIATKHLNALKNLAIESTIYAFRSNQNAEKVDGIINLFTLDDVEVVFDFAIISNPTQLHREYIDKLTDLGINLFIEKPPISSLENSENLINKIQLSGIKTYVACNLRFHPCIKFLKDYLTKNNQKRINEVNIYCGSFLPDWRPNKDFRTIYSANSEMGGGVHLDLFHEIDYTHWLFGKPINSRCIKRSKSSLDINSIDYANYTLEYPHFIANIILNYYRKDAKRTIEIVFEDETFIIDLIKNTIINNTNDIIFSVTNFTILTTYEEQMEYFLNGIKTNQKKMNTFADSVEVLKTCLINE